MKKINFVLIIIVAAYTLNFNLNAQYTSKEQGMLDSLTTLDQDIVKYFPRWKVCESDLQIHIHGAFLGAGFSRAMLSYSNIEILAAPGDFDPGEYGNYQILLITCGDAAMKTYQIEQYITPALRKKLTGEVSYSGTGTGRTYCYKDIPIEIPPSSYQAEAILDYMQPTDVGHALSLSLYEQNVKIGNTGFWLKAQYGNDPIGYQYWSSGEASIMFQRPLYVNKHAPTSRAIPYLMNLYLGGGWRTTNGIDPSGSFLSWIQPRILNGQQNGALVGGLDFHLPVHPQAGIRFNAILPFEELTTKGIEPEKWGKYSLDSYPNRSVYANDSRNVTDIVPVSKASGQFLFFYNWWLNKRNPENYIRFDAGISYSEVQEMGMWVDSLETGPVTSIGIDGIEGLRTYKPSEALDWLYLKAEYRNQANFPFGCSVQLSNQIFLGKLWVPVFGDWLYIEMKYSTPIRDPRPYEIKGFFTISPVIRLAI